GSTVPDAIRERAWFSETRDPVAGPVRRRWGGMGVVPQPERSEGVESGRWWAGGSRPDTIRLPPRCFDSRVPAQPASTPTLGGYGGSSPTRADRASREWWVVGRTRHDPPTTPVLRLARPRATGKYADPRGVWGSSPTRAARGRSRTERFAGDRLQAGGDDDPHENHPEADPGVAAQTEEAEHGVGAEQLHREPEHPVSDQVESQQLPPNGR